MEIENYSILLAKSLEHLQLGSELGPGFLALLGWKGLTFGRGRRGNLGTITVQRQGQGLFDCAQRRAVSNLRKVQRDRWRN